MSATEAKDYRREVRRAFGPLALETLDKQGAAIATLSEDIREAFAQHKSKIDELIRRVEALERA